MNEQDLLFLKEGVSQLLALEILEYHDKNWLAGDNKTIAEAKIGLLETMADVLLKEEPTVEKSGPHWKEGLVPEW
jgi:hypothetical protein